MAWAVGRSPANQIVSVPLAHAHALATKTRLKISSVLTRVQKAISIGTQGSKSQNVLLLAGKACNKLPAYGRRKACNPTAGY
jgi:hypothetical protein